MADAAPKLMTVAEFLEWDDGTDTHYELVYGQPIAMAPPLWRHGKIMGNVYAAARQRLRPPCDVGLQVGIVRPDRDDRFYEADVAIGCGEPVDDAKMLSDPVVVFEILSPSTERHDRGLKVQDYRAIPTIQEIVLVAAAERHIELWRRSADGWTVRDVIGEGTLDLQSVGVSIPVAEIYRAVKLPGKPV